MEVRIFQGYWSPKDCLLNPTMLFIYGDNDQQFGTLGQACIRNCVNALGVPTKRAPHRGPDAYYSDVTYCYHIINIEAALYKILNSGYKSVVFPQDGLGTGLADLPRKAPQVYEYLNKRLKELFNLNVGQNGMLC